MHLPSLFFSPEHSNYFGVDEKLGPVAVSIKREKLEDHKDHGPQYQYRIIFRTSEVRCRGWGMQKPVWEWEDVPMGLFLQGPCLAQWKVSSHQDSRCFTVPFSPSPLIFSQLITLRGSILEDATPTATKHGTVRGLPLKDALEYVIPELNIHCLRLAINTPKVTEQLLKLDEQGVSGNRDRTGVLSAP